MSPAILQNQFVQVALPIIVAILVAAWNQKQGFTALNSRLDDLRADINLRFGEVNLRFGEIGSRLDRIETTLKQYGEKIATLEERTSPVRGR